MSADLEPLAKGIHYMDCDAAPGHRSRTTFMAPPGLRLVSGEMRLNQKRYHDRWLPAANFRILTENDEQLFMVQLIGSKVSDLVLPLVELGHKQPEEKSELVMPIDQSEILAFTLEISSENTEPPDFQIEDGRVKVNLRSTPQVLELGCSTSWSEVSLKEVK